MMAAILASFFNPAPLQVVMIVGSTKGRKLLARGQRGQPIKPAAPLSTLKMEPVSAKGGAGEVALISTRHNTVLTPKFPQPDVKNVSQLSCVESKMR